MQAFKREFVPQRLFRKIFGDYRRYLPLKEVLVHEVSSSEVELFWKNMMKDVINGHKPEMVFRKVVRGKKYWVSFKGSVCRDFLESQYFFGFKLCL